MNHTFAVRRIVLALLCIASLAALHAQKPVISSFTPASGIPGTAVTITGSNFSSTPSGNIVFFGAVRATVTAASATSLTVTVPSGATYEPLSISAGGLTGYSASPFLTSSTVSTTLSNFTYAYPLLFTTDFHPNGLAIADFDGDGKPDVATSNNYSISGQPASLSILRNTSTATSISFAPRMDISTGVQAYALAAGDLNADGLPDLVSASVQNNAVSVFTNTSTTGSISFSAPLGLTSGDDVFGIAIGDIDGDGKPDLAMVNFLSSSVSVFRNTSSGSTISFGPRTDLPAAAGVNWLVLRDIDGDGKLDISVTNELANSISVFRNTSTTGSVSFSARVDYNGFSGNQPYGLNVGDLNADGKPDLAVVNSSSAGSGVHLWKNNSTPGTISFTYVNAMVNSGGSTGYHVAIGDLNGDNKPDLAVSTGTPNTVSLYANNTPAGGTFSFSNGVVLNSSFANYGIGISDLNADGRPDITTGNFVGSTVAVFRSRAGGPAIGSFTPDQAGSGTTVTISGANFTGLSAVSFGGVPAASFTLVNSSTITAVPGAGSSGSVSITTPAGTDSLDGFTYLPAPTITSFTPGSAGTGGTITITGTNFANVASVSFGGVAAGSFTVVNATTITAVVGAGASGNVSVTTAGGTAAKSGFTYLPPPVISSFTPTSAWTGSTVTISGSNFTGATDVSFGGAPAASFTVVNANTITAVVAFGNSGSVKVITPYGSASLAGFTIIPPPPTITSFTPTHGTTNTFITINGTNFSGVNSVTFGGVAAASITIQSTSTIIAKVGAGASGAVSVTTNSGTATLGGFVFVPSPTITSFSPSSGGPGTVVTITGTNFSTVTNVRFGGTPASSFTINSPTSITATVGPGASGTVDVEFSEGTVSSSSSFSFTTPFSLFNFTPDHGVTGTEIVLGGAQFDGTTGVSFGGVPASSFVVETSGRIRAIVGNGATGSVTVTKGSSTVSLPGFTYYIPPAITSFTPTLAGTGQTITITGTNFLGATQVTIGGMNSSFTVVNSTTIRAQSTSNGGQVAVTTPGGTATLGGFVYAPSIFATSFSPGTGGPGTVVTIRGTELSNITSITFGGVAAASFTINSPTMITAVVGSGASGDIHMTGPGGTAVLNNFVFVTTPFINSFTPATAGSGIPVEIIGANFNNVTGVSFGGSPATSFTVVSSNKIMATPGSGASGNVVVTTTSGNATLAGFTYTIVPTIFSFTPSFAGNGMTVQLRGVNFIGVTGVSFGGVAASSFRVDSATGITATVGAGASGAITVQSPNGSSTINGFVYSTRPTIASFSPAGGLVGTTVTINGSNFNPVLTGNVVYFGGVKAKVLTASVSTLTVKVPLGATSQPMTVTSNGLTGVADRPFHVLFPTTTPLTAAAFGPRIDSLVTPASATAFNIGLADLDGDGMLDAVVASQVVYDRKLSVYRNTGSAGTIAFAPAISVDFQGTPTQISFSDLNGDGKLDMLTVSDADASNTSVYINTTTGSNISFAAPVRLFGGLSYSSASAADFDGDGRLDVAVSSQYSQKIYLYKNTTVNGTVSFAASQDIDIPGGAVRLAARDMDMDGKPDLVVDNYNIPAFILRNTSTASAISFAARYNIPIATTTTGMTIGDLDNDGRPDLVLSNNTYYNYFVSVYPNVSTPGSLQFGFRQDLPTIGYPANVSLEDLDGDGLLDIEAGTSSYDTVTLLNNKSTTGRIAFAPRSGLKSGLYPGSVLAGDLDGDERPDIAALYSTGPGISFYRNLLVNAPRTTACPGDTKVLTSNVTGSSYQWQVKSGGDFTNISDNANYSGTATATLTISNIPASWYGYQYRCVVGSNTSSITVLIVNDFDPPSVNANGAVLTVAAPDASTTYAWQVLNGGINWTDIGATGTSYTATQTGFYRVKATSGGCVKYSSSQTVLVVVTAIGTVPANDLGVRLYPNPSEGDFTVDGLRASDHWESLEVLSADGKLKLGSIDIRNKTSIHIVHKELSKGLYLVRLVRRNGPPAFLKITVL